MIPIESPLMFAGFHESVLRNFGPLFQQLGITAAQGRSREHELHGKACSRMAKFAASREIRWRECWFPAT